MLTKQVNITDREQFKEAVLNASACYSLTKEEIEVAINKYERELKEAKRLDSQIITIDELRKKRDSKKKMKL